jgi:hypothetical protein
MTQPNAGEEPYRSSLPFDAGENEGGASIGFKRP